MQVAVLAGGLAARMRPRTDAVPKSLLPVAGRPFLDWQLARLARSGASRVVLCVGHLARAIEAHLASSPPPLPVTLSDEGDARLGTAGALHLAARRGLLDDTIVVTYGDSYLPVPFAPLVDRHRAARRAGAAATMTVLRNDDRFDRSNCVVRGGLVTTYAKGLADADRPADMRWVDYGLLVIERARIEGLVVPAAGLDLAPTLGDWARERVLAAHEVVERFFEIGSPAGLDALAAELAGADGVAR